MEPQLTKAPTVLLKAGEEFVGMDTRFMSEGEMSLLKVRASAHVPDDRKSETKTEEHTYVLRRDIYSLTFYGYIMDSKDKKLAQRLQSKHKDDEHGLE